MDSLIFSMQSVLPLFLLILVGYLLRRSSVVSDSFVSAGTKIVFNIALPITLFMQISSADLTSLFDIGLIGYVLGSSLLIIAVLCIIVPRFIRNHASAGAFIQGMFRGNFAILGVPLAINMFGAEEGAITSLLLPFTVPLYNIMAVVVLTVFSEDSQSSGKIPVKKILKGIITNPLIIAIVIALPFSLLKIQMPVLVTKCLQPFNNLTTPLALLCLGGQCTIQTVKDNLKLSVTAALLKEIFVSTLAILGGILLGFRGGALGAIFITFMAPSAVSSYIMAKNMKSDSDLAGQILIMTTILSCLTLFLGTYILRELALI
ncbi:MAG: AEC family transporter [Lachnospiraceae bacterium]|nr:AEC family transporter [Lachnospiraceae bacterium]